MITSGEWLEYLWHYRNGRKSTIIVGDSFGDNCKRAAEGAWSEHFDTFIRVSGGSNTGGTRWILGKDGQMYEMIFHLVPSEWPYKRSIIGDWVLVDVDRLNQEISQIMKIVGTAQQPLHISGNAPLWLPYYGLVEAYLEMIKGKDAVGVTKRGIAPTIAAVNLRVGPLVRHLLDRDRLYKWVMGCYKAFELMLKELEDQLADTDEAFELADYHPDKVTEQILATAEKIKPFICNTGPIVRDLLQKNEPVMIGLSQGFGLHRFGTYPFNSSGQILASDAASCLGVPMRLLGPTILASKLINTRVGNGPFPTGWWNRDEALRYPIEHPELFSVLEEHDEGERKAFLEKMRLKINGGQYSQIDLAQYMQVLLNNLGATTKRGREPGGPDLHITACACWRNGVDVIALSQMDVIGNLDFDFPIATEYHLDGSPLPVPVIPDVDDLPRVDVKTTKVEVRLRNTDLYGETDLPPVVQQICDLYYRYTGVPVGFISTSPRSDKGSNFYDVSSMLPA